MSLRYVVRSLLFAVPAAASVLAADPRAAVAILEKNCGGCHSDQAAMSGFRATSRDGLLRGGAHGPAVKPGDPGASRLWLHVSHAIQPPMPPTGKLSAADLETLKAWIEAGAEWPQGAMVSAKRPDWWAFQEPKRPAVPPIAGHPVDAFLNASLRAQNLTPAAEAGRFTLLRRATFDLLGLPPTREQIDQYLKDQAPGAWDRLIDSLLASPQYGERWGRHWLDLVRYGDTAGFEQDPYNLEAWRYRDWVIKSFNQDKPYDRFVKEQIAGDELWPEDPEARSGTGYFRVGTNRDMLFKVEDVNRIEKLTDYVDTTSSVFLGLTVGCARCHDHKFDPIPQRDFYRMQAIFAPATEDRVFLDYNPARQFDLAENTRKFKLRQIGETIGRIQKPYRDAIRAEKLKAYPPDVQEAFAVPEPKRTAAQQSAFIETEKKIEPSGDEIRARMSQADQERLHAIEKQLVGMFANYGPPPMAPGIIDIGREAPRTFIAVRGNPKVPGDEVQPGFPTALGGGDAPEPPLHAETTYRRKALAEWMTRPGNPLFARVMANRIWQQHFGAPLLRTPSDFGTRAGKPSHPELLDWLATEFAARGWSIKAMHRLLMTSEAYRRSAVPSPEAQKRDADNLWLSHMNRRRLSSEEIRDSMLASAGNLNAKMFGIPVVPPLDQEELYGITGKPSDSWYVTANPAEYTRRSVYMLNRRNFRQPMFEAFDAPDGILSCSRRETTTTATQSLTLLNGRFTLEQAKALAAVAADPSEAWLRVFGRQPTNDERADAERFLEKQTAITGSRAAAMAELARALFNLNEFLYVD